MNILFVCTGNTCRSPMAQVIAQKIWAEQKDICIASAGVAVLAQTSASTHAIQAVKSMGLDLSKHVTRQLQIQDLYDYDIILTMTENHRNIVCAMAPEITEKVFTICQYVQEEGDIADPFGGKLDDYQACATQLERLIQRIAW